VKPYFVQQAIDNAPFAAKIRADLAAKPQPMTERIAHIAPDTLVVWGDTDKILDVSAADVWRARLTRGTVVIMSATGHAPMLERPRESAALVITWWSRHALVTPHERNQQR
jgi:pimeloyl-ACP methyl ester carboxylesterase